MELNFKVFGEGEPLIILHGLFGSLDNWQSLAKKMADYYRVYTVDQRNHGKSPHFDDISYPLMARDLKQFMDDQQISSSYIIGHSMGGKTAMQFTLDYPNDVKKLVVVDIAPKSYDGGHEAIFEALLEMEPTKLENRQQADEFLQNQIREFGVRQFLLKNLTRNKAGGFKWKMNLSVLHRKYSALLAGIDTNSSFSREALFIRGGNSNYILEEDISSIKYLFPASKLETVTNVGHWVHAEAPQVLLDTVLRFLNE